MMEFLRTLLEDSGNMIRNAGQCFSTKEPLTFSKLGFIEPPETAGLDKPYHINAFPNDNSIQLVDKDGRMAFIRDVDKLETSDEFDEIWNL